MQPANGNISFKNRRPTVPGPTDYPPPLATDGPLPAYRPPCLTRYESLTAAPCVPFSTDYRASGSAGPSGAVSYAALRTENHCSRAEICCHGAGVIVSGAVTLLFPITHFFLPLSVFKLSHLIYGHFAVLHCHCHRFSIYAQRSLLINVH